MINFTAVTKYEYATEQIQHSESCLTTVGRKPSIEIEQATTPYSSQVP